MSRRLTSVVVPFFAVAFLAFSQHKPSAAVDKALRERAAQFLQYTVDKSYRKSYELVAEETKDWYLSSGKPQYRSFHIEGIEYSKDLKQATVQSKVSRTLSMNGSDLDTDITVTDLWKLQGGKWMWYHDPDVLITPFGEIKIDRKKLSATPGPPPIPSDTSASAAAAAAGKIEEGVDTTKKELSFLSGVPSFNNFAYHNGMNGVISVSADIVGDYRAFSVEPRQLQVEGGKDAVFKVLYKPSPNPVPASLRITLNPLSREILIPITLADKAEPTP